VHEGRETIGGVRGWSNFGSWRGGFGNGSELANEEVVSKTFQGGRGFLHEALEARENLAHCTSEKAFVAGK
jgi:hypothetical protein